jgi:hypothetical protein
MEFRTGCKAKPWRIWAELLTIRQIAHHCTMSRAAQRLAGKASGGCAGLDYDPVSRAILTELEFGTISRSYAETSNPTVQRQRKGRKTTVIREAGCPVLIVKPAPVSNRGPSAQEP